MASWKPEILNYFGCGATNAYTEAANGLAKIANRNGRGYSFDAIRAKMIYGTTVKRGLFGEEFDVESPETDHGKEGERVQ